MLPLLVAVAVVFGVSGGAYLYFEGLGARGRGLAALRAAAGAVIVLLIADLTCARSDDAARTLVLLDGSLSMSAAGGAGAAARDSAEAWGMVRQFGAAPTGPDSAPGFGRSTLGPALRAATAMDRPVIVVTDGGVADLDEIPADLLTGVSVRVFPRAPVADVAVTRVDAPARITLGDTLRIGVDLFRTGAVGDSVVVEVLGPSGAVLASRRERLAAAGGRSILTLNSRALGAGDHLVSVRVRGAGDVEPRDDARQILVKVSPLPGAVLLAAPPDWDARQLYATLRDVAALPVRGYARFGASGWRSMDDQRRVSTEEVARAARGADLLILKGDPGDVARGARPRGLWRWPSGEGGETQLEGDWYVVPSTAVSPLGGAWAGVAIDSLAPLSRVTPIEPGPGEWVGLTAQLGRRGVERPIIVGGDSARIRTALVAADGLWRWAFRPGNGEEGYRQLVAATANWLLGSADTTQGLARPVRPVVPLGHPVQFQWIGSGTPAPIVAEFTGTGPRRTDTLQFDGAGRVEVRLPPGRFSYQLSGGGRGVVAVESWSEEFVPRAPRLLAHEATRSAGISRSAFRDKGWPYLLVILLLCAEWWMRRRIGLR
jgi:hypothetical protein